jgi:hypothetical protein
MQFLEGSESDRVERNGCVYTSSVILLFACRRSSWTVFTSSPLAFSKVPKVCRKVCQPTA